MTRVLKPDGVLFYDAAADWRPDAPPRTSSSGGVDAIGWEFIITPEVYSSQRLFTYEESLDRIRSAGYERHAHPAEIMDIIIRDIEGTLQSHEESLAFDLGASGGEWTNVTMRRAGNKLSCYENLEQVTWKNSTYKTERKELQRSRKRIFDISAITTRKHVRLSILELKCLCPSIIKYLWGRSYKQLPPEVQDNAHLWLPDDKITWPIAHGDFDMPLDLGAIYDLGASRGVKSR